MTAKLKKSRHSGESRNPASLPPRPAQRGEGGGEGQREALVVSEGPITPYLAKPQQPRHSAKPVLAKAGSGNPVTLQSVTASGGIFIDGDWVESKDQDPDGDVRLIQLADIGVAEYRDRSSRFLTSQKAKELGCTYLQPGDVLAARMPEPLGRACIFPGDAKPAVTVVDVCIVRPNPDIADARWLVHRINAPDFREKVASFERGSTRKRISRKNLALIEFDLPPLDEQRRIVADLETQLTRLDASVTALKHVQANLKRYRASVLKAACEGALVPTEAELARQEGRFYESGAELLARVLEARREQWSARGRYKEAAVPSAPSLYELPEGWAWASVEQLVAHVTDGDHQPPPQADEGVPFVVIGNVRTGRIDLSDTRFVGRAYYETLDPMRQPKRGDLLYTLVGSYGIPVPVSTDEQFCIQRHMAILRPHSSSPVRYLAVAMSAASVFRQATEAATGTAQKTVPLAGLRRIAIPLPPEAEQNRIVSEVERRLSVIEELEAAVAANLKRGERLRQSVLGSAFRG